MQRWISYLRVSTAKQGIDGLGIEAQREAVNTFATARRGDILAEYVEVESRKRNDRPALADAIAHAKRTGSTLLIAKLDRLSPLGRPDLLADGGQGRVPGRGHA